MVLVSQRAGEDVITVAPTISGKSDLFAGMIDEFEEVETHALLIGASDDMQQQMDPGY